MRRLFLTAGLVLGLAATTVTAQEAAPHEVNAKGNEKNDRGLFNHLDVALSLGSSGIGVDFAMPVTSWVQLRMGYTYMPRFHYDMKFEIQVGDEKESKYDALGNRVETKFDRLAAMLKDLTGYDVDDEVWMTGRPTYHNFKFMVDVFPFKYDKRWHVTAGFFWGPTRFANAYNKTEEMPSLLAVGIYNRLYENTMASYAKGFPYDPIISIGGYEIDGKSEVEAMYERLSKYGRMGMLVGTKNDGTPYLMEPGSDGMVKAEVHVNSFKPYMGVGYGGRLIKKNDRLHLGVDLGLMFWGKPSILTHDGTDLANDVKGSTIDGKVGDYVRIVKKIKVFPALDLRLIYNIF